MATLDYNLTGNSTIDALNKARAENVASGLTPDSGSGSTAAITSSTLTPVQPVKVPEASNLSVATNISSTAGTVLDTTKANNLAAETAAKEASAQAATDTSKGALKSIYERIAGVQDQAPEIQNEYKVAEKTQKYNDVTTQLEASQRAQTNELRAIGSNSALTQEQAAQKTAEVNRRYAFEQADYALIQSAANRDMLTASTLADKKVQLLLEPLKTQLDYTKTFYDENKDALSKAQQNAFEVKIKQAQNTYDTEKTKQELLQKTKLDLLHSAASQNAPSTILAAIQKSETPEAATIAAGQYAGDILKRRKELNDTMNSGQFKFTTEDQQLLVGSGFAGKDLTGIQNDLNKYGLDKVLNNPSLTDTEKSTLKQVLNKSNTPDTKQFLTTDFFKTAYGSALQKAANDAGFTKGGVFGFGASGDTDSYVADLMKRVDEYRKAGYKDSDILKMMQ